MANKKEKHGSGDRKLPVKQIPEQCPEKLQITYSDEPPKIIDGRKIHQRRQAPKTPLGESVVDETSSEPIQLEE